MNHKPRIIGAAETFEQLPLPEPPSSSGIAVRELVYVPYEESA